MPIMNQKEPNKHKMPEVQTFTFDSERNDWGSPWVNFYDSILFWEVDKIYIFDKFGRYLPFSEP